MPYRSTTAGFAGAILISLAFSLPAIAGPAPDAEAWERWRPAAATRRVEVDHTAWDALLAVHLASDSPDGINRFNYAAVSAADRQRLDAYLHYLAGLDVNGLTRKQQQAYWVNLYNALTIRLILDNPGVSSIRKIKDGFFSIGPWDREIIEIDGETLTLNDIEHRILRPLYGDARVHFAVNCASLGCPNLAPQAYTAASLDSMYEAGARAFINHPRGVAQDGKRLRLSSIFSWFEEDFGADRRAVLNWLSQYAQPTLANTLKHWDGRVSYDYDWRLNAP